MDINKIKSPAQFIIGLVMVCISIILTIAVIITLQIAKKGDNKILKTTALLILFVYIAQIIGVSLMTNTIKDECWGWQIKTGLSTAMLFVTSGVIWLSAGKGDNYGENQPGVWIMAAIFVVLATVVTALLSLIFSIWGTVKTVQCDKKLPISSPI